MMLWWYSRLVFSFVVLFALYCNCDNSCDTQECWVDKANKFLDNLLEPQNCTGVNYAVVDIGAPAGFAAQFQLVASEWLKVSGAFHYTIPVLIMGRLQGYSEGEQCKENNYQWTCYFRPLSSCQQEMIKTGKKIENKYLDRFEDTVPKEFSSLGLFFWWGILQTRMFRFQDNVSNYIDLLSRHMANGKGFPFGAKIAGIHVRHGDKSIDGFRERSFNHELQVVSSSPECSSKLSNGESICHRIKNLPEGSGAVVASSAVVTSKNEMSLFVASDDMHVLQKATQLGYYTTSSGEKASQSTKNTGMFVAMLSRKELAYNASLEIIADVYFLSHCNTIVGIAASQIFRMSVDMAYARGTLIQAIPVDLDQLPRIKALSKKYGLPLPETFPFYKSASP